MTHIEKTRQIIHAFLQGDIPAILERIAPDVEWEYGAISTDVPWYQARRGRAGAQAFFESLAAVEFLTFEPKAFLGDGELVVVMIDSDYRVRATGEVIRYTDVALVFRFDAAGRVAKFKHSIDTHQAWLAYHGADARNAA
ncbi:MAG: nuclear transport factor 2 family protein [Gammaproteobacteria bacterium]|nr:nuclear transport factor 2 family protein [Gammaproteobacteria bacterium]